MSTTTDPRIAILSKLNDPPYNETAEKRCVPWDEAARLLDAYRAALLREAADAVDSGKMGFNEGVRSGASWAARMLRRMADEQPQGEEDA